MSHPEQPGSREHTTRITYKYDLLLQCSSLLILSLRINAGREPRSDPPRLTDSGTKALAAGGLALVVAGKGSALPQNASGRISSVSMLQMALSRQGKRGEQSWRPTSALIGWH